MYLHDKDKIKIIIALHLLEIVVKYCISSNEEYIDGASEQLKEKLENNKKAKQLLIDKVSNQVKKITSDKLSRRASKIILEIGIMQWISENHTKTQVAREFMIMIKFFFELIAIPQEDIRQEIEKVFDILLEYENKQQYSIIIKDNEPKLAKIGKNEFSKIVARAEKNAEMFYSRMLKILDN